VRKGETATPVYFYKPIEIEGRTTDDSSQTRRIPMLRTFSVFHASQIDGGGRLGGGRGDIIGTFLGALVLTVALYGIAGLEWLQAWQDFTMGIILVLVVLTMR
jgi:ABC-type xylose transport system permease subunit